MTTYQAVYGKGHIFYAVHTEHNDPRVELLGWVDQHGEIIPNTQEDYPYYLYTEDTRLTALWGRYVVADANGACFRFDASLTALSLLFPTDTPFSGDYIAELTGEPINFDDMKYLAGWATDPNAEEPDVIDGETDVMTLTRIYAIWKDDSYYIAGGENQTWNKGSEDGLSVTVKRTGDDTVTFSLFTGVKVDGTKLTSFRRDEGSLILTLLPDYLETLSVGEHTLRIEFTQDEAVETAFTVADSSKPSDEGQKTDPAGPGSKSNQNNNNNKSNNASGEPKTGDGANILLWVVCLTVSLTSLAGVLVPAAVSKAKNRS